MTWPAPTSLDAGPARLEPLQPDHHDDLVEAVRDGELWNLWYTSVPTDEGMAKEIERRLSLQAAGSMLPFAVIETASSQAVGMTTYMNIDAANRRLEIGSTWYRKRVQRSPINTACKRALLAHAFEELGCIAVEFRTHSVSRVASRNPVMRVGFRLLGRRRQRAWVTGICERMARLTAAELRAGGVVEHPAPGPGGLTEHPASRLHDEP